MNPIVDGEPAGWNPGESFYNVVSKENSRILIPQPQPDSYRLSFDSYNNVTQRCFSASQSVPCRHEFHIPSRVRTAETLPADVANIAAALNYQVHISQGALQYCDLIYHTLIGSFKDQPNKSPDIITKLEDLQKQVQQLSSKVGEIRLSQKDIDQMSSKIGTVISGSVQFPSAEEIASKIKVPTAREITHEIGELSLNEYTKSDLVNRISKSIPVSGVAKDIADKISIPPFKVPTAAEIASQIRIQSAADLASQMKIPSAQDIANQIYDISEAKIDYNRIASEVVNRIHLPETQSIDIYSLAQKIADLIPKCDPNNCIPPPPAFPTDDQIAFQVRLDIPTAQEIANKLASMKSDIVLPVNPSAVDYSDKINKIDKKCDDIITALGGNFGEWKVMKKFSL